MKKSLLGALVLAGLLSSPAQGDSEMGDPPPNPSKYQRGIEAQVATVAKTQGLLSTKLETRQGEMRDRIRAIYKLSRSSFPRIWFEPEARQSVAQWLGAARRIQARDREEIALLHQEIAVATAAEKRLSAAGTHLVAAGPALASLNRPIANAPILRSFGEFKGPSYRVRLRRRGVELTSQPGDAVQTPGVGRVRYVGPISGLGQAVIVDHDGYLSIVGRLVEPVVKVGEELGPQAAIGKAAGQRLYLEIRLSAGAIGQPVDPAPLLAPIDS